MEKSQEIIRKYSLIGYHCTRLTKEEIESIKESGLLGQNSDSLNRRIDNLLEANMVTEQVAKLLKEKNQANEDNRAKMLWFCFFEPHLAGELGIGRFFNSWGGEALYNSHEDNPVTGAALRRIGIPCIIKADVAISAMNKYRSPIGAMARVLLHKKSHHIRNSVEHEGYSTQDISPGNIIKIIEHPSREFNLLTKNKEWKRYAI